MISRPMCLVSGSPALPLPCSHLCLSLPLLCSHLVLVSTSAVLASGACLQGLRHRLNDWTACASSAAPSLLHPTHRLNDVSSAILAHAGRVPPSPQKAPESRRRGERDQALPSVSREDPSAAWQASQARMLTVFHPELGSKSRKAFLDSGEFGARIPAEVLPSHPALYGQRDGESLPAPPPSHLTMAPASIS